MTNEEKIFHLFPLTCHVYAVKRQQAIGNEFKLSIQANEYKLITVTSYTAKEILNSDDPLQVYTDFILRSYGDTGKQHIDNLNYWIKDYQDSGFKIEWCQH